MVWAAVIALAILLIGLIVVVRDAEQRGHF